MKPPIYIIILIVMFSFLLLSRFRVFIIIGFVLFAAYTLIRYLFWSARREEEM